MLPAMPRRSEDELLVNVSPSGETATVFAESTQSDSGEIVPPDNYFPALRELGE